MWHSFNGTYGHMMGSPFGWFFMILFWVILIVGLYYLLKALTRRPTEEDSALDILRKRYARGEISKEEFQSMKKELSEE